jgi:hypothetical protein
VHEHLHRMLDIHLELVDAVQRELTGDVGSR